MIRADPRYALVVGFAVLVIAATIAIVVMAMPKHHRGNSFYPPTTYVTGDGDNVVVVP